MVKVAIIDYGLGNLRSIKRGLEKVNSRTVITHEKKDIRDCDGIVLPGVGAFEEAIKNLRPISDEILNQIGDGKPLLGICLGLQLLFSISTEGGIHKGLDIFKGRVIRLPSNVKIPHIGWNTIKILKPENPLYRDIPDNSYVYFVHSYYGDIEDKNKIISVTDYGVKFPSAVADSQVFATQFHPEKSGRTGLQILKNFVSILKS